MTSLGRTLNGREIDYVTFGNGPRKCWIIHRQHPGETMASFFAEGLLLRLLGIDDFDVGDCDGDGSDSIESGGEDAVARDAREIYTFHVVPNMKFANERHRDQSQSRVVSVAGPARRRG